MATVELLKVKYPGATACQLVDSAELASNLADLIKKGSKWPPAALLSLTSRKSLPRKYERR